jgi:hypothetical protein
MQIDNYELCALDNNRNTCVWNPEVELIWSQMYETLRMRIIPQNLT